MGKYTYAGIMFFTIVFPFLLSFDKKVNFRQYWKPLFQAIAPVAAFFILWDAWFTSMHVWWFSEEYLVGIFLYNLPLEECLFFILVPYACLFIYEVLQAYFRYSFSLAFTKGLTYALLGGSILLALWYYDRAYTCSVFVLLSFLLIFFMVKKEWAILGKFYPAYGISLIPFLLVNGLLTAIPVVNYDPSEQVYLLIYTIPFEDAFYGMLLLLGVTWIFEQRKKTTLRLN